MHGATMFQCTSPEHATRSLAGIGMVHQHFTLVPVDDRRGERRARRPRDARLRRALPRACASSQRARASRSIHRRVVESLSVGAQQRVEIVKALVRDARVLILDEPTAVLAPAESAELLRWLRAFADAGNAVVLITHKLREALSVADDVTVLRRGRTVLTARASTVTRESLTEAMLGSERAELHEGDRANAREAGEASRSDGSAREIAYRAQGLTLVDGNGIVRIRNASFTVRAGEIVGIAGVEGSGQRELLRVLAGRTDTYSGTLMRPADVGFIPEDRHHDALLLERDLVGERRAARRRSADGDDRLARAASAHRGSHAHLRRSCGERA